MPDPKDETTADEATTPDTPLHAYKDREEDVVGDPEVQRGDDDLDVGPPVPEKH